MPNSRRVFVWSVVLALSSLSLIGVNWDAAAQIVGTTTEQQIVSAQIREGMNLAAASKARVAESYLTLGVAPQNREGAGLTPGPTDTQGRYTASIDIVQGEIIIAYGNDAHQAIAGKVLILTPMLTTRGHIVWQCGYSTALADVRTPMGANTSNRATTVDSQYLISACRDRTSMR